MEKKIKMIAHRGASWEAPENTLEAFQKAIDFGADLIECDVRLSQTGVPILIHDPPPKVLSKSVPTFDALLALDFQKTGLMIEIKEREAVQPVYDRIQSLKIPYFVGSLSFEIVQAVHELDSTVPLIGIAATEKDLEAFLSLPIRVMAVHHTLATPRCIEKLLVQGIEVWAWTIDDPSYDFTGLDGVITNNLHIT